MKLRPDTIVTWIPPANPGDPWRPVEARRIVDGISGETAYSRKELGAAIRKKIGAGNDNFIDGILDEWFTPPRKLHECDSRNQTGDERTVFT